VFANEASADGFATRCRAHAACNCAVAAGQRYCSGSCSREAAVRQQLRLRHSTCAGRHEVLTGNIFRSV
jgi:hypothetical protein